MKEKGVKVICNIIHFIEPKWLSEGTYKPYVVLNEEASEQDVDLFLSELYGYNRIDFGKNPKSGLGNLLNELDEEGLCVGGGVVFFENNQEIVPSCCCGLEEWREILEGFYKKESPWMGHDPNPILEYKGNQVIVGSDDYLGICGKGKKDSSIIRILFEKDELEQGLIGLEKDIISFIKKPFYNRIKKLDEGSAEALMHAMLKWLIG